MVIDRPSRSKVIQNYYNCKWDQRFNDKTSTKPLTSVNNSCVCILGLCKNGFLTRIYSHSQLKSHFFNSDLKYLTKFQRVRVNELNENPFCNDSYIQIYEVLWDKCMQLSSPPMSTVNIIELMMDDDHNFIARNQMHDHVFVQFYFIALCFAEIAEEK